MTKHSARLAAGVLAAALSVAGLPGTGSATITLLQPGPEGSDVAPYSFLPSLPRGNRETQWMFVDADDSGFSHSFETFVHFSLPPDLIPPGEELSEAYVWVVFSFEDSGFGDDDEPPVAGEAHCHEVLAPWSESNVTWSNKPAYGPAFDVQSGIEDLGLIWCDVTSLVAAWASGSKPNHGIALTNPTTRTIGLYSFEATNVEPNLRPSLVVETLPAGSADGDGDGVHDVSDNCRETGNGTQDDTDGDGAGDACDVCPGLYDPGQADADDDGVGDACSFAGADLTRDGVIDEADLLAFVYRAATESSGSTLDLDGDGAVGPADLALWLDVFDANVAGAPTAGQACGALTAADLAPFVTWWVEQGRAPTAEFLDCYGLP